MRKFSILAGLVLLAATACGTSDEGGGGTGGAAPEQPRAAQEIVAELAQRVPTAKPGVVFTEATDPNHLLGRPGGYLSKASWTDSRVPADEVIGAEDGAVEFGGSVEVFADETGARARKDYIDAFAQDIPFAAEYSYVHGGVLLRVSRILTPQQAAEYEQAMKEIGAA